MLSTSIQNDRKWQQILVLFNLLRVGWGSCFEKRKELLRAKTHKSMTNALPNWSNLLTDERLLSVQLFCSFLKHPKNVRSKRSELRPLDKVLLIYSLRFYFISTLWCESLLFLIKKVCRLTAYKVYFMYVRNLIHANSIHRVYNCHLFPLHSIVPWSASVAFYCKKKKRWKRKY